MPVVAVVGGSTAVAMAAEVHGSIAGRRLYRTHLRGAENQSVSRVLAMNSRVFSVILLPTSECNVACDYCFPHQEPHRLSSVLVPLPTRRLLDHPDHERIERYAIYCQGAQAVSIA